MHTDGFLKFLGWALLTFSWLNITFLFFGEIANAINEHNVHIRRQAIEEYIDDRDESEDESKDE